MSRVHVDHRHTFRLSYVEPLTGSYGRINGKPFTPGMQPLDAPYLGTVEEWTLINESEYDHPFHIHVNGFQVMSVEGKRVHANGHQDVVNIPKQHVENSKLVNGRVVIRQRFETYTGWFVFHCHILEHEDVGMMAAIQVRNHGDPEEAGARIRRRTCARGALDDERSGRDVAAPSGMVGPRLPEEVLVLLG